MAREKLDAEVEQLEKELDELLQDPDETSEDAGEGADETQNMDTSDETDTDKEDTSAEEVDETQDDASETSEDVKVEDTSPSYEDRYKEVQAYATKLTQQNAALLEQLQSTITPPAVKEEEEKKAVIDFKAKLAEEYPELTELLLPAVESIVSSTIKPVQEVAQELTQDNMSRVQREFNDQLVQAVPNVMELVQTDDFSQWLKADTMLPSATKAQMFISPDIKEASSLLGQYQLEKRIRDDRISKNKKIKNKNTAAKDAVDAESGSKSKNPRTFIKSKEPDGNSFTQEEIDKMSLDEFEKREPEIMEALSKGLIF